MSGPGKKRGSAGQTRAGDRPLVAKSAGRISLLFNFCVRRILVIAKLFPKLARLFYGSFPSDSFQ